MSNWKTKWTSLLTGEGISIFTSSILQMAFVWYLSEKTGSAAVLSIAMLFAFVPQAFLSAFIGVYVDRWKRKVIMVLTDLLIALLALIIFIYSLNAELTTAIILIVLFLRGIGSSFHQTAFSAITPLIVPEESLAKAGGANQGIVSISTLLSPAVAAVLYNKFGLQGAILLDIAGAVFASVIVMFINIPELKGEKKQAEFVKELKEGYSILKGNKGLFYLVIAIAYFSMCFMPLNALFPLMSLQYFGGTTWHASIIETAFSAGMLGGSLIISIWGGFKNKVLSMTLGMIIVSTVIVFSGLLQPSMFILFIILCTILGFSAPLFNVPFYAIVQQKIAAEYLGRVFGIINLISNIGAPIGLLLSTLFADKIGVSRFFLLSGILLVLEAFFFVFSKTIHSVDADKKEAETGTNNL